MTKNELYNLAIGSVPKDKVPMLYQNMMEECCETVVDSKLTFSLDEQVTAVRLTFLTALSAMKGVVKAGLAQADKVTLTYRGEIYEIEQGSPIEKMLDSWNN